MWREANAPSHQTKQPIQSLEDPEAGGERFPRLQLHSCLIKLLEIAELQSNLGVQTCRNQDSCDSWRHVTHFVRTKEETLNYIRLYNYIYIYRELYIYKHVETISWAFIVYNDYNCCKGDASHCPFQGLPSSTQIELSKLQSLIQT